MKRFCLIAFVLAAVGCGDDRYDGLIVTDANGNVYTLKQAGTSGDYEIIPARTAPKEAE